MSLFSDISGFAVNASAITPTYMLRGQIDPAYPEDGLIFLLEGPFLSLDLYLKMIDKLLHGLYIYIYHVD